VHVNVCVCVCACVCVCVYVSRCSRSRCVCKGKGSFAWRVNSIIDPIGPILYYSQIGPIAHIVAIGVPSMQLLVCRFRYNRNRCSCRYMYVYVVCTQNIITKFLCLLATET